jgi:hypothetical protein
MRVRWVMLVLALAAAAAATWWLYAERRPAEQTTLSRAGVEDPGNEPYMRLKYGTLTVQVRGPDLKPVLGAQVGWETAEGPRLYYTDMEGRRTLTDVPLGSVRVVAQARGFKRELRDTRIEAGLPEELTFILSPAPADGSR